MIDGLVDPQDDTADENVKIVHTLVCMIGGETCDA